MPGKFVKNHAVAAFVIRAITILNRTSLKALRDCIGYFADPMVQIVVSDVDHLAMNCFLQGACCLFKEIKISTSSPIEVASCKKQFEAHYGLTKGKVHQEQSIRQKIFGDQANYLYMRAKSRKIFFEILRDVINKR